MNEFEDFLLKYGIKLTEKQRGQLDIFEKALIEKNAVMNLVSKKDEKLLRSRHFLDSLAAVPVLEKHIRPGDRIADCGSGAGFPGIPLSAAFPENSFDLLDSLNKRCVFLNEAATAAGLVNVKATQKRLGEGRPEAIYSFVTERAMGHLETVTPLCARLLKPGGYFLAWQSAAQVESVRPEVDSAVRKAHLSRAGRYLYRLPGEENDRYILIFVKI